MPMQARREVEVQMQLTCDIRHNELGGQQQALVALSTEKRPGID